MNRKTKNYNATNNVIVNNKTYSVKSVYVSESGKNLQEILLQLAEKKALETLHKR